MNTNQKLARGLMTVSRFTDENPSVEWSDSDHCFKMIVNIPYEYWLSVADLMEDYGWEVGEDGQFAFLLHEMPSLLTQG